MAPVWAKVVDQPSDQLIFQVQPPGLCVDVLQALQLTSTKRLLLCLREPSHVKRAKVAQNSQNSAQTRHKCFMVDKQQCLRVVLTSCMKFKSLWS